MEIRYNAAGSERKRLVKAISAHTGAESRYLGAPSFAYAVDYFTVTRDGTLVFDDMADTEEIEALLEALEKAGFMPRGGGTTDGGEQTESNADNGGQERTGAAPAETAEESAKESFDESHEAQREEAGLTVTLPLKNVNVSNLLRLLDAKGNLIRKALGAENLGIEISESAVSFPWFKSGISPEDAGAYTRFISALCGMSRRQKRVTCSARREENEKYAFRCFLLRLGFIGKEYRLERKILLRNLEGSSAFKSGVRGGTENAISA